MGPDPIGDWAFFIQNKRAQTYVSAQKFKIMSNASKYPGPLAALIRRVQRFHRISTIVGFIEKGNWLTFVGVNRQVVAELILEGKLRVVQVLHGNLKGMVINLHVKIRTNF